MRDVLTTGQVAQILHVAPVIVSRWKDNDRLQGYCLPGSKDRRIPLKNLINFMNAHSFPRIPLLRYFEDFGANEDQLKELEIEEAIGSSQLRLYPELTYVYTTGQVAIYCGVYPRTVAKWTNSGLVGFYRFPETGHKESSSKEGRCRRIPADELAKLLITHKMPIPDDLEAHTPIMTTYPGGWDDKHIVWYEGHDSPIILYRQGSNGQEVSIRANERDGLYVKHSGDLYTLLLLGMLGRKEFGTTIPAVDYVMRINGHLVTGKICLGDITKQAEQTGNALEVLVGAQEQLREGFPEYFKEY